MNPVRKTLLLSQALWAKYTVRLAPEAPGERHGIVSPSSFVPEASARPLRLVAIGDSLVAGSGVEHQDLALTPRIARKSRYGQSPGSVGDARETGVDHASRTLSISP